MNGPEHYREAERLLGDRPTVRDWRDDPEKAEEHWRLTIAAAQVHATLALAAATVEASDGIQIVRPQAAAPDIGESARLGTPWGRAFYGDAS